MITSTRRTRSARSRLLLLAALLALPASLLAASPASAASTPDGRSQSTAAASCWEIKQGDSGAKDGTYWLLTPQLVRPQQFYCDMTTDGGGWVLIGRGRDGWKENYDGQGTTEQVSDTVTGTGAFRVRQLGSTVVDALNGGRRVDSMTDGVRVRRASNTAGTQYQEVRFRFADRDRWVWSFGAGHPLSEATIAGKRQTGVTTRDFGVSDDIGRVFTFDTSLNGYVRGFNYGLGVAGTTAAGSYLYSTTGKYATPFAQVFIRPKLRTSDLTWSAVPDAGLPASTNRAVPQSGSIPTQWGVTGNGAAGTGENSAEVQAFAQVGNVMYVGGNFTTVQKGASASGANKISQPYLAAFDATTGDYLSSFKPPTPNNQVKALVALPGGRLAVGGEFTKIGSTSKPGLVVLNASTGAIDTAWTPTILNKLKGGIVSIRALDVSGDYLYVGGAMTHFAKGSTQTYAKGAGRIKISTRTPDSSWNPEFNGTVTSLDLSDDGTRAYYAGYFTMSRTSEALRAAAFSTASGAPRITPTWKPTFSTSTSLRYQQAVEEVGSRVWLGGSQHSMFGYDRTTFALNKAHVTRAGGDAQAIASDNGLVYQGCHCENWSFSDTTAYDTLSPGQPQVSWTQGDKIYYIGAYDATSGDYVPSFTPEMRSRNGNGVWAIDVATDGTVWAGGTLTSGVSSTGVNQWLGGFARFAPRPSKAPGKPSELAANLVGTDATISWKASSTADVLYEVLRNDRVVATTRATSVAIPNATSGDRYFVRASDDAGNRSATTAVARPQAAPSSSVLLPARSTWTYEFDDTATVPQTWTDPGFEPTGWKSGRAPFGFGANGAATDIDVPSGTRRAVVSRYRTTFQIAPGATVGTVTLTTRADDAVAAWVNGVEVGRSNLDPGPLSDASYAKSAPRTSAAVESPVSFEVPVSALRQGENVVSISVHSMYRATPDSSMDATIVAQEGTRPVPAGPSTDPDPDPDAEPATLLGQGSTWSYLFDDSVTVPSTWAADPDFSTAAWRTGVAPLGFGGNGVTTDIDVPDGTRRAVVSYYRTTFDVAPGSTFGTVKLTTIADDAVAAYVNGVEVGRSNLDPGELSGSSYAKSAPRTSAAMQSLVEFEVPVSVLREGVNEVSVSVHSMYRATPDSAMDAEITATPGTRKPAGPTDPAPTSTNLVAEGSSWSWLFSASTEPPSTWRTSATGTSGWASGAAPLGFGSSSIVTNIDVPQGQTRGLTSYMRRTFSVGDPAAFSALTLTTRADDGIAVYVNGVEILRSNLPGGTLTSGTYATTATNTANAAADPVTVSVPRSVLRSGENTIAVEVHSNYRSTVSQSMDLSLVGTS